MKKYDVEIRKFREVRTGKFGMPRLVPYVDTIKLYAENESEAKLRVKGLGYILLESAIKIKFYVPLNDETIIMTLEEAIKVYKEFRGVSYHDVDDFMETHKIAEKFRRYFEESKDGQN